MRKNTIKIPGDWGKDEPEESKPYSFQPPDGEPECGTPLSKGDLAWHAAACGDGDVSIRQVALTEDAKDKVVVPVFGGGEVFSAYTSDLYRSRQMAAKTLYERAHNSISPLCTENPEWDKAIKIMRKIRAIVAKWE